MAFPQFVYHDSMECSAQDCTKLVHAKGLCQAHYRQALRLDKNGGVKKAPGPKPDPTKWRSRHNPDNPGRLKTSEEYRRQNLKYAYDMTPEEWDALLFAQNGRCAVCKLDILHLPQARAPHTDHDHYTGKVRGILCHHCNLMLGQAKDSVEVLQAAIAYLQSFSETTPL